LKVKEWPQKAENSLQPYSKILVKKSPRHQPCSLFGMCFPVTLNNAIDC